MKKTLLASMMMILAVIASQWRPDRPFEVLKPRFSDHQSQFMDFEGMPVHFKDEGSGDPVLLLHGTASSLHTWDGWTSTLAQDYRVIRLDLPGYGLTGPNDDRDYSTEWYVDFLARWLEELDIQECHLAGNSLGGHIAWRFALRHPQRVKKLILLDASGYPNQGPLIFRLMKVPLLGRLFAHCTPRYLIHRNVLQVYGDKSKVTPALVDRYYQLVLRAGNRQATHTRFQSEPEDRSHRIREIRHQTLIQWGGQDTWIPSDHGHRFERDLPDSRLIVYPELGHVPMEENAKETVLDALAFLKT